jgi:hypothetical protein
MAETSWAWWFMPEIPATWEAEVGGSRSKAVSGSSVILYLKKTSLAQV